MGVWSPKVNEEPRDSTNPGLVGSEVGTWGKAKWLSGGKLEKCAKAHGGRKGGAGIAEAGGEVGGCSQPLPGISGRDR